MKGILLATLAGLALVGLVLLLTEKSTPAPAVTSQGAVTVENGKQIVSITAKGGYSPKSTKAEADMPTLLRIETTGTFDCSSALRLPSLDYEKNLPPSGVTEVELPPQPAGTVLKGLCSMGMYGFEILFE